MASDALSTARWKRIAVALAIACAAWFLYDTLIAARDPALDAQSAADRAFEDGHYERALALYRDRLAVEPGNPYALRGVALSLMQLGRNDEALAAFAAAIAAEPDFAGSFANRGILHDRMGAHAAAIADYERALALDPEVDDGPGWLTLFLRNQPERPPTIADRLAYLKHELAKPEGERMLRLPEEDQAQRPYQQ
jgi:tetratricopeptide (TPR) repeat protein